MLAAETAEHAGVGDFPILTVLILLPAVGALFVALLSKRRPEYVKLAGLVFTFATAGLSLWLLRGFDRANADFQFGTNHEWIDQWGIGWNLGVDGISLFLVVLTGVLFPIALLGSSAHHDEKPYTAWILLLQAGVMGSFLSRDLFLFFVFFEIVLVPMYFLIGGWGYDQKVYASLKFFIYTMASSALMLVAIIATVMLLKPGGEITFDMAALQQASDTPGVIGVYTARWLFAGFAIAFAVKVPVFPFHTWLPDAHTQAPTAGSVILAGVLLKMGTYGLIRFAVMLFPEAAEYFRPLMLTLAVIGIIYGAVVATMQKDLKRLVAYSSVAHMGFIVLGIFAFTAQSMTGAVMQMINHGVSTGALFLMVGMISERRHTREIASLKGLQQVAPVFAGVFTLVMLSSIGVPGLNGFMGEFLILIGSFLTAKWWTVVAASGVIIAALYLLWAYQRVFHGEVDDDNRNFAELTWREGAVLAPLLGVIVFTGIYPKPMLERIEKSVCAVVIARVEPDEGCTNGQPADHELPADDAGHGTEESEDDDGHGTEEPAGDDGHGTEEEGE